MKENPGVRTLGDVCNIVGGGTPSKARKDYYNGKIPWATVRDMRQEVLSTTEFCIAEKAVMNSSTNVVPRNNVVIATRVGLGKACILAQDTAINQDLRGLIPKRANEVDTKYLLRWVQAVAPVLQAEGTGMTVKGIKLPFVKSLKIRLPHFPEQKRIVAILDKAFAGIDKAIANAEKNLANAHELFESYLHSVFTERGEGWVDKTLQEISVEFGRGKSKHRPRNDKSLYGGAYPFVQTGDVRNASKEMNSYSQTYNEMGLAQSKLWPKGTICITIAANIAETAILMFDACFPDSIIGVVVDPKVVNNEFVEYVLQFFRAALKAKGKGSAQDNINMGTFEKQRFPFPDLGTQKEIVARLNSMMKTSAKLADRYQKKLDALTELKQSILHKAFSGELTALHEQALREAAV